MSSNQPTRQQKLAKARFWQRASKNTTLVVEELSDAQIAQLAGTPDIQLALKKDEFRSWFLDVDANAALLEAGVDSAIRRLIDIVEMSGSDLMGKDAEAKASDQVRAADLILRYSATLAKSDGASGSKDIDKLTQAELDSFIKEKSKRLKLT